MDSNAVFIDDLFIPEADRIGEEGRGFHYIPHSLNPERILIGAEAIGIGHDACWQAIATHGGMGYAREHHVERLYREVAITCLAPITEQLILNYIGERVLDMPRSY